MEKTNPHGCVPASCKLTGRLTDLAVLAGIYIFLLSAAHFSLDYGRHWDEVHQKLPDLKASVETMHLLPRVYDYPGGWYILSMAALVPDFLRGVEAKDWRTLNVKDALYHGQGRLQAGFADPAYVEAYWIKARFVFATVCLCLVFGVYFAAAFATADRSAALASAAIAGGSFEYFYHAKFIAPDALMALCGILAAAFACRALQTRKRRDVLISAACAGLTFAAKYPGGLLLLATFASAWLFDRTYSVRERVKLSLLCVLVFVAVFLVITPGAVLMPINIVTGIATQLSHYKFQGHGPNTVLPGLTHLTLMAQYLALFALTPVKPVNLALIACAGVGLIALCRKNPRTAAVCLVAPLVYVVYFATQRVMIVRNYLILIPFLAVLAGIGVSTLMGLIRQAASRVSGRAEQAGCAALALNLGLIAVFAAALAPGYRHIWTTSQQLWQREAVNPAAELTAYLDANKDKTFFLSPRVREAVDASRYKTTQLHDNADGYVYFMREDEGRRLRNHPDLVLASFGLGDINLNYYNDWIGYDRIMVLNPRYFPTRLTYAQVPRALDPYAPWNAAQHVILYESGLTIALPDVSRAGTLELSLAKSGNYLIDFLRGAATVGTAELSSPRRENDQDERMAALTVTVPQSAETSGYDAVRITPTGGVGDYSLGHIVLK